MNVIRWSARHVASHAQSRDSKSACSTYPKARGNVYLDRLETHFRAEGVEVLRFKKPTFTRPAPVQLIQEIAGRCDLVVEGLAD